MLKSLKYLVGILLASAISGCLGEIEKYSPIPEVWFKEYRYYDSTIVIGFRDGDGDIGLPNDSLNRQNLFLWYHILKGNDTIKKADDKIHFSTPYLETPVGNNKTLTGDIEIDITNDFLITTEKIDSFFIEFYLFDRAMHQSNRDTTPILYPFPKY